jgi:hypothetical protein
MNLGTSGLTLAGKGEAADVRINSYDSKKPKRREEISGCDSASGGRPRRTHHKERRIALHNNPTLTAVRQSLEKMGETAARTLLERLEDHRPWMPEIVIEPESVVRDSTAQHQRSVLLHTMLLSQRTMPSLQQRPGVRTHELRATNDSRRGAVLHHYYQLVPFTEVSAVKWPSS